MPAGEVLVLVTMERYCLSWDRESHFYTDLPARLVEFSAKIDITSNLAFFGEVVTFIDHHSFSRYCA